MLAVTIILIVIVVSFLIREYVKNKSFYKLPSPPSVPILGHIYLATNKTEELTDRLSNLLEDFDGFVALYTGPWHKGILLSDHRLIRVLCTSDKVRKSNLYKVFKNWMGTNLFTAEGTIWKKLRKFLTPVFHLDILKEFTSPYNSVSTLLIEELRNKTGKPLDVQSILELWALDAIVESVMGTSVNALKNSDSKYVRSIHEITRIIKRRLISPIKTLDFFFWFSRDFWKERAITKYIDYHTNMILEEKIKARNQKTLNFDDSKIGNNKKKRLVFLDLLLEKQGIDITDQDMCNYIKAMLFGGSDTIGKSVGYTLYLLSLHNEIQEKAFTEIRYICGDNKYKVCTYEDFQEMTYLDMIIKESLRLYPPAPVIGKYTLENIEYNGNTIPKGTDVGIAIYCVHRREKYFPNPLKFDPDRFSSENQEKIIPFTYIPFGAGPRNCIGQKVAMLEMKIVLSTLLRNFKILPVEEFQLKIAFSLTLEPGRDGIQVILKDREY